ncbi:hypothetical protein LT85_0333 [Collimonas arenae]|uniref:Uncharacterized protein n=1 Tax=Collimonas arenae TaxID=279058 RepID=A0A0A1F440_9BURK|nr:hypothetical protein LT85_0333 [Collimonas arenae]
MELSLKSLLPLSPVTLSLGSLSVEQAAALRSNAAAEIRMEILETNLTVIIGISVL